MTFAGTEQLVQIIVLSAAFASTMKLADLLDEHGMHWFKWDAIIFGILWGFFGSLLIISNVIVSNIILALVIAFLVRLRLDFRNHTFAAAMILIAFLSYGTFDLLLFSIFFVIFSVFGGIKDYLGDVRLKKDFIYKLNEFALFFAIPAVIYSFLTGLWIVSIFLVTYFSFYNLTKYGLYYMKKYERL